MATNPIADLYAAVKADMSGFDKDLEKGLSASAKKSGSTFGQRFKSELTAQNVGKGVALGLGINLTTSPVELLTKSVGMAKEIFFGAQQAASNLAEQQAKLGEVFTTSADDIRDWASTSATSMGLSERAAIQATGTLGNFLQAMGTGEEQTAEMSMGLVQLSADISSFNNVAGGAEEVLQAIQSGLSGETEPLRRFGIDISDAAVQAELLSTGQKKVNGQFTMAQKIQGRYAIIMRQTAAAQGDYLRTAESSANQSRTLDALQENLNAKFGVFADKIINAAQGLAIDLVNAIDAVGAAWGNVMKFLDPQTDFINQQRDAVVDLAEKHGLNAEKALEVFEATLKQEESARRLLEVERLLEEAQLNQSSALMAKVPALEAERDALMGVSGAAIEAADAVAYGPEAYAAAIAFLDDNLMEIPDAHAAAEQAAEDGSKSFRGLAIAIQDTTKTLIASADKSSDATREIKELAGEVDLAKGAFGSFWKEMEADQKRIRFFIRNPDKLREELDKIQTAIEKGEKQKQKLLKDGLQEEEVLALAAIDRKLAKLRGRAGQFGALGQLYGQRAETGMEQAFDPTLRARIETSIKETLTGNRERAHGGPVFSGLAYLVGEKGPELFVPENDGVIVPNSRVSSAVSEGAAAAGGDTYNTQVFGLPMRARTPREVVAEMRRSARLGRAKPPRRRKEFSKA